MIERELERYCPAHYILYMDEEGAVCISCTDALDYENDVSQALEYDASYLDAEMKSTLEEGLVFNSLEEINAHFESLES